MYREVRASHSKIATYKQCPRKYKYRYIERIKTSERWPHLVKGNFTHDVLEIWINSVMRGAEPKAALQEAFKVCRESAKYQSFGIEKYIDEIRPWLKDAYADYAKRRYVPLAVEQSVKFKYRGIIMSGRIDRIDHINDRTIKIIDYKTSKDAQYLTDLQVGIYHMAVKYGSLKPKYGDKDVETAYVLLRHGLKEKPYTFTVEDLDGFLDEIELVVDQIMTDKVWEPRPSHMCQYCDYFVPCMEERGETYNFDI